MTLEGKPPPFFFFPNFRGILKFSWIFLFNEVSCYKVSHQFGYRARPPAHLFLAVKSYFKIQRPVFHSCLFISSQGQHGRRREGGRTNIPQARIRRVGGGAGWLPFPQWSSLHPRELRLWVLRSILCQGAWGMRVPPSPLARCPRHRLRPRKHSILALRRLIYSCVVLSRALPPAKWNNQSAFRPVGMQPALWSVFCSRQ